MGVGIKYSLLPSSHTFCFPWPTGDGHPLALTNPKVRGKSCGALHVRSFSAAIHPTFLDYLRAGAEINFLVAVVSRERRRNLGMAEGIKRMVQLTRQWHH